MKSAVYAHIHAIIPDMGGWCTPERAVETAAWIMEHKPKISVGIGVWHGRLEIAMALAHRYIGHGRVIAIDPWDPLASIEGQNEADAQWWSNQQAHMDAYDAFMKRRRELCLEGWIQVEKKRSDDFSPPRGIGFLSVDGNHGPQSIRDVRRYAKNVSPGGLVFADDIDWSSGHVKQAVAELVGMGFRRIADRDKGAYFLREK